MMRRRRCQGLKENINGPGRRRGVYEIPVGPVHAGIIEPGHFRFQAVGETVLNLEERLGYVHKGIEKSSNLFRGKTALTCRPGIGRYHVAHSIAYSMAVEAMAGVVVPERAPG